MAIDYCSHLRQNGELFVAGARRDMDAHVPSCPEWNVGKLTIHLGIHHRWVAEAVRGGGEAPGNPAKPGLRGDELLQWLSDGVEDLAKLLDESDDATTVWTWSDDKTIGFWRRRTSLETLVHRWDAENATGDTTPMDPEIAADCADEMLTVFVPDAGAEATYRGPGGSAVIRPSDFDRPWSLQLEDERVPVLTQGEPSGADVTVTASAEDLALLLWGRTKQDVLEVTGDPAIADSFVKWLTL